MKNEAWILDRFLRCASLWADVIILADQGSVDGSREIAARYPKVRLIENTSESYNEVGRQRMLLSAARAVAGTRIIIALDADEVLTANWRDSAEWQSLRAAEPGTAVEFRWVNICPDMRRSWIPRQGYTFGYVDDGREHQGCAIHSTRVPHASGSRVLAMHQIKVLHYQYTDWKRMKSKHRWYQCWEVLNRPDRRAVDIFREYHHMDMTPPDGYVDLKPEWFEGYTTAGIDMTSVWRDASYYWDIEVLKFIDEHGAAAFSKLDVWDVDWAGLASALQFPGDLGRFRDPRTLFQRQVHQWLRGGMNRPRTFLDRLTGRMLRFANW